MQRMGVGTRHEQTKELQPFYLLFTQSLHSSLLHGQGATAFIQRKPQEREGQNWTRGPLIFAELWRPQELPEAVLVTCHLRGDSLGDPRCLVNTAAGVVSTRFGPGLVVQPGQSGLADDVSEE